MKFILPIVLTFLSVAASAQSGPYIRVNNVAGLKCEFTDYPHTDSRFYILGGSNETIVRVLGMTKADGDRAFSRCRAALYQARQDRTSIYIDPDTGAVLPEDGFFVRQQGK